MLLAGALLVACGDGGGGVVAAGGGTDPSRWARSLCTALDRWIEAIDDRSTRLGDELAAVASLEEARDRLAGFMDDLVGSTDRLLAALDAAGHPDVERGRALARDLRQRLAAARGVFVDGRRRAAAVSVDDQQAFQAEATGLSVRIQAASSDVDESIEQLSRRYPSVALDRAFTDEAACHGLNAR